MLSWWLLFLADPPGACQNMEHASMNAQLPTPFETDFHHQLGPRLSVFPRNLSFQEGGRGLDYWPDLATFTEDFAISAIKEIFGGKDHVRSVPIEVVAFFELWCLVCHALTSRDSTGR